MNERNGVTRRASPADLDQLLTLARVTQSDRERTDLLTQRVHSDEVIVFEQEHQLLGFVVAQQKSFFGRDFVEQLTVNSVARRQGIGSLLLREAVDHSSSDRIFTSTNQSNLAMNGLLAKAQWHLSGQLEGLDKGDPEFVYYNDAR